MKGCLDRGDRTNHWLVYGETHYGESYSQALDETEFSYSTLRNLKYVSSRIELSFRNDNLTWSHHKCVAPFEPKIQKRWLDMADQENWSREEFKKQIKLHRKTAPPPGLPKAGERWIKPGFLMVRWRT